MCVSFSVYYCASILKANQTVVLTRQIWFKPEWTKDMLNMAVLIHVRGRPLRVYACIHFEIEILVVSLSLIQLALSTCSQTHLQ